MCSLEEIQDAVFVEFNNKYDNYNQFTLDTPFKDWGFDSLDILEIILNLESSFKVRFDDSAVNSFNCPRDISNYLDSLINHE